MISRKYVTNIRSKAGAKRAINIGRQAQKCDIIPKKKLNKFTRPLTDVINIVGHATMAVCCGAWLTNDQNHQCLLSLCSFSTSLADQNY
jgi:hypothetical protein